MWLCWTRHEFKYNYLDWLFKTLDLKFVFFSKTFGGTKNIYNLCRSYPSNIIFTSIKNTKIMVIFLFWYSISFKTLMSFIINALELFKHGNFIFDQIFKIIGHGNGPFFLLWFALEYILCVGCLSSTQKNAT